MKLMRVAVLSDIHAYVGPAISPPSHLSTATPENEPRIHPFAGLRKLIRDRELAADVVICCGDMGDKATPDGIRLSWRCVNDLAVQLQASITIGTAGNHDIDSRALYSSVDPTETLRALVPPFPIPTHSAANESFWANHYAILDTPTARIVVLNSSAYHAQPDEREHGRVSQQTLARLEEQLEAAGRQPLNILLCHHHPYRHGDIDVADYSAMVGAPELMNLLDSGRHGPWVVFHGHKHHPRIAYAPGSAASPVIFAAGSLCVDLHLELQSRARNQFYVVEFHPSEAQTHGLLMAATFEAWDWARGVGWVAPQRLSGLPKLGGFGFRLDGWNAAGDVARLLEQSGEAYMWWSTVLRHLPRLAYLSPIDAQHLVDTLEHQFGISSLYNDGRLAQIGRMP